MTVGYELDEKYIDTLTSSKQSYQSKFFILIFVISAKIYYKTSRYNFSDKEQ